MANIGNYKFYYIKNYGFQERDDNVYMNRTDHVQEYNHHLIEKYNYLCEDYTKLKCEVEKLFNLNIQLEKYSDKLLNHVDDVVVNEEYENFFKSYEINKNETIQKFLKKRYYFNETKISSLLDLRKKMLTKRIESLDIDNIGTSLNILREFYNDVHIDIERNKITPKGNLISYSHSLFLDLEDRLVMRSQENDIQYEVRR